jgi:hypothetical protein
MYHCPIIWWNKKQLYAVGLRVLTRISRRRNEAVHPSPVDIAKIHSVVSGAIILAQISSQRRVTAGESPMKLASLGLFREGKHNKVSSTFCWGSRDTGKNSSMGIPEPPYSISIIIHWLANVYYTEKNLDNGARICNVAPNKSVVVLRRPIGI